MNKKSYAAFFLTMICVVAVGFSQLRPGVGYSPRPGAMSYAGTGHGHAAVPLNQSIDPWANGTFNESLMAGRYGEDWIAGVPGPHSTDYANYFRIQFAERTARWGVIDYSLYDGEPTQKEITDAYYTKDARVLPIVPHPEPTPTPAPTPDPIASPTPAICPTCPPSCAPSPAIEIVDVPVFECLNNINKLNGPLASWGNGRRQCIATVVAWINNARSNASVISSGRLAYCVGN